MANVYDALMERGAIAQASHPEELRDLLGKESVTFYIGYDATAPSLHVGHFATLMAMMVMQQHGHRPIALIGGGTTMVGDPTGRSEMRPMLTRAQIQQNGAAAPAVSLCGSLTVPLFQQADIVRPCREISVLNFVVNCRQ